MNSESEIEHEHQIDSKLTAESLIRLLLEKNFSRFPEGNRSNKKNVFFVPGYLKALPDFFTAHKVYGNPRKLSRARGGRVETTKTLNTSFPDRSTDIDNFYFLVINYLKTLGIALQNKEKIELLNKAKQFKENLEEKGFEVILFEKDSLGKVIKAINERKSIHEIDINKKIKSNPLFRFLTVDNPELSLEMSEALSTVNADANYISAEVKKMGNEKKIATANNYAINIFDVISKIQNELKLVTNQEIADELNKRNIPTQKGKEWKRTTLEDLTKRWKKLGLVPNSENKPK